MLRMDSEGRKWRSAECKEFQVEYIDTAGRKRKYWPDFIVDEHIVVECKPTRQQKNKNVQLKAAAMRTWCDSNGYEYQIIAPRRVNKEQLQALIDSGDVVMEDRYVTKIKSYIKGRKKRKVR